MRSLLMASTFVVCAGLAAGQGFECSPLGNFPAGGTSNCENATGNGAFYGRFVGATNVATCGWPVAGTQYARAQARGPVNTAPGGPFARPANGCSEIQIPCPEGVTGVSFRWNFFNAEGQTQIYNDGMDVSIVDAAGNLLVACVYADAITTPIVNCTGPFGDDTNTLGAETFSTSFAALPAGAYLSICCWNGMDDAVASNAVIDCIGWGNSVELGNISGPRVVDLNPATSFKIGVPMSVRMDAGLPFIEGSTCMVAQIYDGNFAVGVPGFAGPLYICMDRPFQALTEGLLTGGINPGRSSTVTFTVNDPAVCGVGLIMQAYVITEQLTNPTFTTALVGFFR